MESKLSLAIFSIGKHFNISKTILNLSWDQIRSPSSVESHPGTAGNSYFLRQPCRSTSGLVLPGTKSWHKFSFYFHVYELISNLYDNNLNICKHWDFCLVMVYSMGFDTTIGFSINCSFSLNPVSLWEYSYKSLRYNGSCIMKIKIHTIKTNIKKRLKSEVMAWLTPIITWIRLK